MSHHVIYIPGLGDTRPYGQNIVIQIWRIFGLKPHYLALGWNKIEGYGAKQSRIVGLVESLTKSGNLVSLVGASAGASAALNAYANCDDINKIVCISGKINNASTIGPKIYEKNPDFKDSMDRLSNSISSLSQRQISNIMSTHPWRDETVPIADTIISGAKEKTVPGWSHVSGIFFGIIFGSRSLSKFILSDSLK